MGRGGCAWGIVGAAPVACPLISGRVGEDCPYAPLRAAENMGRRGAEEALFQGPAVHGRGNSPRCDRAALTAGVAARLAGRASRRQGYAAERFCGEPAGRSPPGETHPLPSCAPVWASAHSGDATPAALPCTPPEIGSDVARHGAVTGAAKRPGGNGARCPLRHAATAAASAAAVRRLHFSWLPPPRTTVLALEVMTPLARLHAACMASSPCHSSSGTEKPANMLLRAIALHTIP